MYFLRIFTIVFFCGLPNTVSRQRRVTRDTVPVSWHCADVGRGAEVVGDERCPRSTLKVDRRVQIDMGRVSRGHAPRPPGGLISVCSHSRSLVGWLESRWWQKRAGDRSSRQLGVGCCGLSHVQGQGRWVWEHHSVHSVEVGDVRVTWTSPAWEERHWTGEELIAGKFRKAQLDLWKESHTEEFMTAVWLIFRS